MIGRDPTDFGEHSGRRGGATAATEAGVSWLDLKRYGRWVSDSAPQRYVETTTKLANTVPAALAKHKKNKAAEWTTDARLISVKGTSEEERRKHDRKRIERKRQWDNTISENVVLPPLQGFSSEEDKPQLTYIQDRPSVIPPRQKKRVQDIQSVSNQGSRYVTTRSIETPINEYRKGCAPDFRGGVSEGERNSAVTTQREWKAPRFIATKRNVANERDEKPAVRFVSARKLLKTPDDNGTIKKLFEDRVF